MKIEQNKLTKVELPAVHLSLCEVLGLIAHLAACWLLYLS